MNPDNELRPKRKDLHYVPNYCRLALWDECGARVASGLLQKPGPSSAFPPEATMVQTAERSSLSCCLLQLSTTSNSVSGSAVHLRGAVDDNRIRRAWGQLTDCTDLASRVIGSIKEKTSEIYKK